MKHFRIKVYPNKNKTKIIKKDGREDIDLHIELKAKADDNKANIELIKFLSKQYNKEKDEIKILSGLKNKIKEIRLN